MVRHVFFATVTVAASARTLLVLAPDALSSATSVSVAPVVPELVASTRAASAAAHTRAGPILLSCAAPSRMGATAS